MADNFFTQFQAPAVAPATSGGPNYFSQFQPGGAPAKADDTGDFMRGVKVALGQTVPILKGVVGLAGATAENALGEGGISTAVKNWGLKGYTEGMDKLQPMQRDTDELTTAWDKAKSGDIGALVDWLQYGLGYAAGQGGEALAMALVGGAVGAAVGGGAASPVTGAGGAITGLIAKGAVKETAQGMVKSAVVREANAIMAKAGADMTADQALTQATKNVARNIGSSATMLGYGSAQELGSIYPEAEAEAAKNGRALDGADLARVWGTGLIAGGIEGLTDKLGVDAALGKVKFPGGASRAGNVVKAGLAGVGVEGGTEALQTGIERVGAGQEVFSPEGVKDIINSAGLGAVGGGAIGGAAGFMHGKPPAAPNAANEAVARADAAMDQLSKASTVDEALGAFSSAVPPVDAPTEEDLNAAARRQREADRPQPPTAPVLPDDIVSTLTGQPFTSMEAAAGALARAGEGEHELVPVDGGLVVRRKASPFEGSITEVPAAPFKERLANVREQVADSRVRQQIRDTLGPDALGDVLHYAQRADDDTLPGRTSDNMLSLAENLLTRAQIQPLPREVRAAEQAAAAKQKLIENAPIDMAPAATTETPQPAVDTPQPATETPQVTPQAPVPQLAAPVVGAAGATLAERVRSLIDQRQGMPGPRGAAVPVGNGTLTSATFVDVKRELGLPHNATQADVLDAARAAGVQQIAYTAPDGPKVVDVPPLQGGLLGLPGAAPNPQQQAARSVVMPSLVERAQAMRRQPTPAARNADAVQPLSTPPAALAGAPAEGGTDLAAGGTADQSSFGGAPVAEALASSSAAVVPDGSDRHADGNNEALAPTSPQPSRLPKQQLAAGTRATMGGIEFVVGQRPMPVSYRRMHGNTWLAAVPDDAGRAHFGEAATQLTAGQTAKAKADHANVRLAAKARATAGGAAVADDSAGIGETLATPTTPAKSTKPLQPERSHARGTAKHPQTVMGSTLLARVSMSLGGLHPSLLSEFSDRVETGRKDKNGLPLIQWRNPLIPGVGRLFRAGGTSDYSRIAGALEDYGYLPAGSVEADHKEAGERAKDLIRGALNRDEPQTQDEQTAQAEHDQDTARHAYYEQVDAESAAELEAERAAIMSETSHHISDTDALTDDDILDSQGTTDTAGAMRAMGFTEQEIADELAKEAARGQAQGSAVDDRQDDAGEAGPSTEDRGTTTRLGAEAEAAEGLTLQTQTVADLQAKTEREQAATDKEHNRKAAEQGALRKAAELRDLKTRADATVDDFNLGQDADQQLSGTDDLFASGENGSTGKDDAAKTVTPEPPTQTEPTAPAPAAGPRKAKIDDFGEVIHGARKEYAAAYKERMEAAQQVDMSAEPLSKSWPEPDYEKMLESGLPAWAVALARAARDAVPTKPQTKWKLEGWVDKTTLLRDFGSRVLSGDPAAAAMLDKQQFRLSRMAEPLRAAAALYFNVGHGASLKGIRLRSGSYSMYEGVKHDPPLLMWVVNQQATSTAMSNWGKDLAVGKTRDEAIDAFKAYLAEQQSQPLKKAATSFDIYRKRGDYFIGKKIGREHVDLKRFDDIKSARQYLADHRAELEAALARYKTTPFERKTENAPRVGDDHRSGGAVTAEAFADTFGFRGVQFGNYVEGGRRQSDLNQSFDALMDLAAVLGVPPRALSLNGRLGLAFGAQGAGGVNAAAAHYEPGNVVINLTKGAGPGSLAHEWWHALDNYFAKKDGGDGGYMTGDTLANRALRAEMQSAFMGVREAIKQGTLRTRSLDLDKRRSKPYWATPHELSARSFESYVIAKLQDQGAANDYLANVVSKDAWDRMEAMRSDEPQQTYPYPTVDEMPALRAAFDRFFQTVEARPGDNGNVMLATRAFESRSMFRSAKYATGRATVLRAKADAEELLGVKVPVRVATEAMPDKKNVPMRYDLTSKTVFYNTAAEHAPATDVQYMLEELLHAVDHIDDNRTVSASNPRFLPGGDIRTEIEQAMAQSAAMQDLFNYPINEKGYSDTQKAAELFARIGVLYHGNPNLLELTAPTTYASYAQAFGVPGSHRPLPGEVRQLPEADSRIVGGRVTAEARQQPGGDARTGSSDARSNRNGATDGLQRLRDSAQRALGGSVDGQQVDFGHGDASLETRGLGVPEALADAASNLADRLNAGPKMAGRTNREYTAGQAAAMRNVGFEVDPPTIQERVQGLWKDAGKKLAQGIVDQFAPVKDISKEAYGLLRLSKGASGAFEAFLRGGQLKLTDGVYDFDDTKRGGVVEKLLTPLQGEHHDFLRWVAANRAERLKGAGKENLFSEDDIKALKSLSDGVSSFDYTIQHGARAGQVTRDRTLIYPDSLRTFNDFQSNVLDMAEQSGLIDPEARKLWEHEFYVPFYRVEDDGTVGGADIKNGAVRQQAFKGLTGRTNKLNHDLLDNTLMNWAHLLDASAKNRAARATIVAAEAMGAATRIDGQEGKGTVWYREKGERRYSMVEDPHLLAAITALEYTGMRSPVMKAMGALKHALTVGVTASPFFKVRNLIRDSVQVIGTSPIGINPVSNISEGWKLTDPKSDAYFRLLAGGGTIHFGTMMEGSEAKRVQQLVEAGVSDSTILNDDKKVQAFYRKVVRPGIEAYNELGNRGEAINRAALYDHLVKAGASHADASLQARDLMDFSMQGTFGTIRFLTQVVPFFNARVQGLYKLGRTAKEDPARFSAVIGACAVASIGLLLMGQDDDDWKKREDWDRNNYWWFKFGGTAFRVPKPFEIGAIATLAERGFEYAFDKEMTGQRFRSQVMALLGDNLSMNPIPQLVKPMLDVYANVDSFSGRPIETMGMERLKPEYRFTDKTTVVSRGLSTAANAVTGLVGKDSLSPVQIDHLIQGYFGWLGAFVVGAGDVVARIATDKPAQPTMDYWKAATGGMVSDLRDAPSRYVSQMYTQAKAVEEAYGTWQALRKQGKGAEAAAFFDSNKDEISKYRSVENVKRSEGLLNAQIRMIQGSDRSGDEKRALIRDLQARKDRLARVLAPTD